LLLEDREVTDQTDSLTPGEQQAMLRVISEEADRLDRFVESIVDLARIEAGDVRLNRNWGSVDEIIEAAVVRAEPLIQRHSLKVSVEEELPVIRVDARAVAEVVYTLIDNATKYGPHETFIDIEAERAPSEMVQISVEDQGPGIPSHLRERVFDKFFRASDGRGQSARDAGGIGMGLAIAKGIVEAHGGQIWIEDGANGHGTRVIFTVPVGDDEQPVVDDEDALDAALTL
jgi:two-component system sensor histidine kinase KdpD